MRYLLNSVGITLWGNFSYRPATVEEARDFLSTCACGAHRLDHGVPAGGGLGDSDPCARFRPPISTIGYQETADALSALVGLPVAVDRRTITMAPGDEALVFRVVLPPGAPRIAPGDKGRISQIIHDGQWELGILRCIEAYAPITGQGEELSALECWAVTPPTDGSTSKISQEGRS